MRLILFRHGPAVDRESYLQSHPSDDLRPLTFSGKRKVNRVIQKIARSQEDISTLITSPLKRAEQTAQIIHKHYKKANYEVAEELKAEASVKEILPRLKQATPVETLILVGHEPHLSRIASYLLTGNETNFIHLKKAGAIALEFGDKVEPGSALLRWHIHPGIFLKR